MILFRKMWREFGYLPCPASVYAGGRAAACCGHMAAGTWHTSSPLPAYSPPTQWDCGCSEPLDMGLHQSHHWGSRHWEWGLKEIFICRIWTRKNCCDKILWLPWWNKSHSQEYLNNFDWPFAQKINGSVSYKPFRLALYSRLLGMLFLFFVLDVCVFGLRSVLLIKLDCGTKNANTNEKPELKDPPITCRSTVWRLRFHNQNYDE